MQNLPSKRPPNRPNPGPWPMNLGLLRLSDRDSFMLEDALAAVHIWGSVGAGKSSGSGQSLAHSYCRAGMGGLVMGYKPGEIPMWEDYAKKTGRLKDLVYFGPGRGHCFNFIDYEMSRKGPGAGNIENIACMMEEALESVTENQVAGGDPYWRKARGELIRNMLTLEKLTRREVRWYNVTNNIHSLPRHAGEPGDPNWRANSTFYKSFKQAYQAMGSCEPHAAEAYDLMLVKQYVADVYAPMDPEPRSSIVSMVSALADILQRSPVRELLLGKNTLTPEAALEGKIILLDMSIAEYQEAGRFVQVLFKNAFQRMALRRRETRSDDTRPIFLWADEAHEFTSPFDHKFQPLAREFKVATVYLSQSIQNYYAAMGGHSPARAKALITAFSNHIFHAGVDPETNKMAEDFVGMQLFNRFGWGDGVSYTHGQNPSTTYNYSRNWQQQWEPVLRQAELTKLRRGGEHGFTDAVLLRPGKPFHTNGLNMLPLCFPQTVQYAEPPRSDTA